MPNTLSHSLSPHSSPFSLCSFVFGKKNYNTLLFLTFIKAGFCYFWKKKNPLGTHEILLCPFACD